MAQRSLVAHSLGIFAYADSKDHRIEDNFTELYSACGGSVVGLLTGVAAAATNTALINAALALGGTVSIVQPGTYTVGASQTVSFNGNTYQLCLSIPSNTRFVLGKGVILQVAAGLTNPVLIQNSGALTTGNINISLEGGQWDGNKANSTRSDGTCLCSFMIWMSNVTNLDLRRMWLSNSITYHTFFSSLKTARIQDIRCYDTAPAINGDGIHIHGNCTDVVVRNISGNTGDDLIVMLTYDPSHTFTIPLDSGPISDILIDGVFGDATAGAWHLVNTSGAFSPNYPLSNLTIRNVFGKYVDGGILINGALAEGLTIDGVTAEPLAGSNPANAQIALRSGGDTISISNVKRTMADSVETGTKLGPIVCTNTFTWTCVKLTNIRLSDTTAAGASVNLLTISSGVTIASLEMTNINALSTANSNAVVSNSGTIGSLMISNMRTQNIKQALFSGGNITTGVYVVNYHGSGNGAGGNAFFFSGAFTIPQVSLHAVKLDGTQTTSGCLRFVSTSGSALVQMSGCSFNVNGTTNPVVARSASESVRVQSIDTPVPSGTLTPVRGDMILDASNSSDPFRWSGTAWVAL